MNEFFWIALPYLAFAFFLGGTVVRYTFFERGWSAKSSEFLEKKQLKIAGPLFHIGLLFTFGGHFGGILCFSPFGTTPGQGTASTPMAQLQEWQDRHPKICTIHMGRSPPAYGQLQQHTCRHGTQGRHLKTSALGPRRATVIK